MPSLTYTVADFIPFTTIFSADVNSRFNDIKTLLNTTGLDDTNLQNAGITRSTKLKAGTASYVLINDGTGKMSEEAQLALSRGGLGADFSSLSGKAGNGIVVNDAETGLGYGSPSVGSLTESLATDVATITAGEAITALDAVCLDVHNGTGSNVYRVFRCDSDLTNRRYNFLGFAAAGATVVAGTYTWVDSAALVSSNSIAWSINGRSYTQAFSTDNDTTLAAISTQIATDPDVQSSAVVDAGSNDRQINITAKGGLSLNITGAVVTGGASQATITITNTQAPSGQSVRIRCFGPLGGFSGLTVGVNYYLSGTTGAITSTPTDDAPIFVGQALSTTVLFVNRNVGSFQFGGPEIMVKSHGDSTGETIGNVQANVEHFNFTSWSAGTAAGTAKTSCASNSSALGGFYLSLDGKDSGGIKVTETALYNKASWSSGTARSTGKHAGGNGVLSGAIYCGNGASSNNLSVTSTAIDKWNGASWTNGIGTMATDPALVITFTQSSKVRWIAGVNSASATPDRHSTFDGASASTDTVSGITSYAEGGSASPGSKGISGTTGSNTKEWNGSAWSSNIAIGFTRLTVSAGVHGNGAATAFSTTNNNAFSNGGSSAATTSITTTGKYNGTSWSTTTASSTARAGCGGAIY